MSRLEPFETEATNPLSEPLRGREFRMLENQYRERCLRLTEALRDLLGAPRFTFLRMMSDHGAVEPARRIVQSDEPSPTFTKLYLKGRGAKYLHMTVEAVITTEREWDPLFTDADRDAAEKRLRDHS